MCGIAGYLTNKKTDYRHAVAVAVLAKHMEERGGHSWGAMDSTQVLHGLGSINLGLTVTGKMPQHFALHTRYGTTGARIVENSHPFTLNGPTGTVVGMHNGIISNHEQLNRDLKRAMVVDSQHIFANIADGRSLDNLEGYGAIVYRVGAEWFIGRFNEGEMKVAVTSIGVFFASTKDAILEALSFAGVRIQKWLKVKNNNVYRITETGLTKAYKIDAFGTRLKWNDTLKDAVDYYYAQTRAQAPAPAPAPAPDATSEVEIAYDSEQCDWCGAYGCELYAYERQTAVCADCYYEVTNDIPAGFDASSY